MATPVIMPRQGQSVESCIIAKWHKKKGQNIQVGDILFSYETDKAAFDEEAKIGGTVLAVFFEEGDDVPVLTNVCVIGNEGESTAEFDPRTIAVSEAGKQIQSIKPAQEFAAESVENLIPSFLNNDQSAIRISPRAKNLAEKSGIDYRYANPSGPGGRIIERDINILSAAGPKFTSAAKGENLKTNGVDGASGTGIGGRITTGDLSLLPHRETPNIQTAEPMKNEYTEVKLTNIRKVIAKAMLNSLSTTAQLTLNSSFDASDILAFRKKLKENNEKREPENITLNDILLYTISRVILNHQDLNAHFLEDKMLYYKNVHLGIAVDTERGLMVPTLFNANLKSLPEISAEVKNLVKECQSGAINPDYLKGAGFTITNLGTLGIESFTPVLNPPQTGILGVNNIVQRIKESNGAYKFYPAMGLSLTFDHRALDGAPAAKFIQELINKLENFSSMLI